MRNHSLRIPLVILVLGVFATLLGFDRSGHATTGGDTLGALPGTLEELLESALRSNPEILVKDAELREAIAALNQTRLAVTQQVVRLHFQRVEEGEVLNATRRHLTIAHQMNQSGNGTESEIHAASIELAQAEGSYARLEADLRYAIGSGSVRHSSANILDSLLQGANNAAREVGEPDEEVPPKRPIPEAMQQRLAQKLNLSFEGKLLSEALSMLAQATKTNIVTSQELQDEEILVQMSFHEEMTFRQILVAIADTNPVVFVFREYGILARWEGTEPRDGSPTIP